MDETKDHFEAEADPSKLLTEVEWMAKPKKELELYCKRYKLGAKGLKEKLVEKLMMFYAANLDKWAEAKADAEAAANAKAKAPPKLLTEAEWMAKPKKELEDHCKNQELGKKGCKEELVEKLMTFYAANIGKWAAAAAAAAAATAATAEAAAAAAEAKSDVDTAAAARPKVMKPKESKLYLGQPMSDFSYQKLYTLSQDNLHHEHLSSRSASEHLAGSGGKKVERGSSMQSGTWNARCKECDGKLDEISLERGSRDKSRMEGLYEGDDCVLWTLLVAHCPKCKLDFTSLLMG